MPELHRIEDLARPRLPGVLRAINAAAGPIAPRLVRLDEASLFDAARRRAGGLEDFGDPQFREPLRVLLNAFETEADQSALGRFSTRQLVIQPCAACRTGRASSRCRARGSRPQPGSRIRAGFAATRR